MKQSIIIIALILRSMSVYAVQPPSQVASNLQASRDSEKRTILNNELTEQVQLVTELQQKRALDLQNGTADELKQTENRLAEVNENIHQLQQEIQLASGQKVTAEAVSVNLVPPHKKNQKNPALPGARQTEQATTQQEPWWDLYHQGKRN